MISEKYKIAMKDWESLNDKQRVCMHKWVISDVDINAHITFYQCINCRAPFKEDHEQAVKGMLMHPIISRKPDIKDYVV